MGIQTNSGSDDIGIVLLPPTFKAVHAFSNNAIRCYVTEIDKTIREEDCCQMPLPLDYQAYVRFKSIEQCNNWQQIMVLARKETNGKPVWIDLVLRGLYMLMWHHDPILSRIVGKSIVIPKQYCRQSQIDVSIIFQPTSDIASQWKMIKKPTEFIAGTNAVIPIVSLEQ